VVLLARKYLYRSISIALSLGRYWRETALTSKRNYRCPNTFAGVASPLACPFARLTTSDRDRPETATHSVAQKPSGRRWRATEIESESERETRSCPGTEHAAVQRPCGLCPPLSVWSSAAAPLLLLVVLRPPLVCVRVLSLSLAPLSRSSWLASPCLLSCFLPCRRSLPPRTRAIALWYVSNFALLCVASVRAPSSPPLTSAISSSFYRSQSMP